MESRFAKDILEIPGWLTGGEQPSTVRDGVIRADRLDTMRSRLSAAYKGVNALLIREGAQDFRSGQNYGQTVFFDEGVDIHHIFPQAWCEANKIERKDYDTVVNKTPLAYRTNRIIGGVAPSKYLQKLEVGSTDANGNITDPPIAETILDSYLQSHCIPVRELRADDFRAFIVERRKRLLKLISTATGHAIGVADESEDEGVELSESLARDSDLLIETP